jgi:hypothetical protein
MAGFQAEELKMLPNLDPNVVGVSSETLRASKRQLSSGFGSDELPVVCGAFEVNFVNKSSRSKGEIAVKR